MPIVRLNIERLKNKLRFLQKFALFHSLVILSRPIKRSCAVYDQDALSEKTAQRWLCPLRSRKFHVENVSCRGPRTAEKKSLLQYASKRRGGVN